MPYEVYTKDKNPYCVKKTNGKEVGCSDKEHIGGYLGKLDSVSETEIGKNNEDKSKLKKGYDTLKEFLNNKKVETSNVYKILTSGEKLSKDDKKDLIKFAVTLSKTAIFLLPFGSIPILAYNIIKNKDKKPEEIKKQEEIMENKLVGGRADNETIKDIAKKFRVPVKYLKQQLKKGMKVESEHTDDKEKQKEIAEDHLAEFPNYYIKLSEVEDELKDYWKDRLKNKVNQSKN